jgi:hypothetical protein
MDQGQHSDSCFDTRNCTLTFGCYSRPAHTIAFGTFWMIVPHVAIVSSLLLAGNNPNLWAIATGRLHAEQQVTSTPASNSNRQPSTSQKIRSARWAPSEVKSTLARLWRPSYDRTTYRSAWLWNRGPCKAMWVAKYAETHPRLATTLNSEVQDMGIEGWLVSTFGVAVFLIVLPCFFSAAIRYVCMANVGWIGS